MTLYGSNGSLIIALVIAAMAVHQATNVLLRSSLIAPLREKFELGESIRFMPGRVYGFLQRLFGCAWCMSIQLSWILLLPFVFEPVGKWCFTLSLIVMAGKTIVISLAVSLGANLIHQFSDHDGPSAGAG